MAEVGSTSNERLGNGMLVAALAIVIFFGPGVAWIVYARLLARYIEDAHPGLSAELARTSRGGGSRSFQTRSLSRFLWSQSIGTVVDDPRLKAMRGRARVLFVIAIISTVLNLIVVTLVILLPVLTR